MTDHAGASDDDWMKIPQETWDEFFRLVRLGIHKPGTCLESLGYTRQAITMRKKRERERGTREFTDALEQAEAQGRIALTQEMIDIAKKAGQWQALSRRLEIVHGELHPVDEAKVESLRRLEDPEHLRAVAATIGAAFGTLPVNFERSPIDEGPRDPDVTEGSPS